MTDCSGRSEVSDFGCRCQFGYVQEGATIEIVAPTIGGLETSAGKMLKADHKIGGGPSVLFDAVAILASEEGVAALGKNAAASDFIAHAFGHLKFIAFAPSAKPLLQRAGTNRKLDEGCIELSGPKSAAQFVAACRKLRHWEREHVVTY